MYISGTRRLTPRTAKAETAIVKAVLPVCTHRAFMAFPCCPSGTHYHGRSAVLRVSSAQSSYPVIIFSHGNQNNAIDYVYTLEALASFGYIVAAPDHVNNTQDDVRIDFINDEARKVTGNPSFTLIPCFDGFSSPCAHTSVSESMSDRVNDIRAIIDALPTWFWGSSR